MPWVAPVIAGVGAVAGAVIGGNAAEDAANTQANATRDAARANERATDKSIAAQKENAQLAIGELRKQYETSRADLKPFQDSQLSALQQAAALTDPNNPYYQAQRAKMSENIQRQLAAQGLLRSKSQVDLLSNLELGLESERFNRINQLAGTGAVQTGAQMAQNLGSGIASLYGGLGGQLGSTFANQGNTLASLYQAGGANAANAKMTGANATIGGLAGVNNAFQSYVNSSNNQSNFAQMMDLLKNNGGGVTPAQAGFAATVGSNMRWF